MLIFPTINNRSHLSRRGRPSGKHRKVRAPNRKSRKRIRLFKRKIPQSIIPPASPNKSPPLATIKDKTANRTNPLNGLRRDRHDQPINYGRRQCG